MRTLHFFLLHQGLKKLQILWDQNVVDYLVDSSVILWVFDKHSNCCIPKFFTINILLFQILCLLFILLRDSPIFFLVYLCFGCFIVIIFFFLKFSKFQFRLFLYFLFDYSLLVSPFNHQTVLRTGWKESAIFAMEH